VVALAVAPLSSIDEGVRQLLDLPYPVLADPDHQVAEAFNVYDLLEDGYAAPSVFIIDTDGSVSWSYVGQGSGDRPSVAMILENLP
jgi:alkyl hydroperoxide reductase subunit AhpC